MRQITCFLFCLTLSISLWGRADKMRIVWVENPAYNAHVGWSSTTHQKQTLYVSTVDHGKDTSAYEWRFQPEVVYKGYKGMLTQFVRLSNLMPNSKYYLVWGDKTSVSSAYFFQTAPDEPTEPLSLIIGGDSRNNREARQHANILVGRLRPHAVLFAGDMTDEDKGDEWQEWLDDWQLTRSFDRRLTPIIVARGNHERSNEVMVKLFDVPEEVYYAQTLGGSLLRVYSLNSEINPSGNQKAWLEEDLTTEGAKSQWKLVQYHKPMRPHVKRKREGNAQYDSWASLFYEKGVDLVYECDGHVAKITWPIRPDNGTGSDEGFVRDDRYGTMYLGEGGWGAPLREVDDSKNWTRAKGSFNHFNWLWVNQNGIELRTVKIPAGISQVLSISLLYDSTRFSVPRNLTLWNLPEKSDFLEMLSEKRKSELENLVLQTLDGSLFAEESPSKQDIFFSAKPNPLSEGSQISLACYARKRQMVGLLLFDQRGRQLYRRRIRVQEGDNRFNVDTGLTLSGIYYLAIQQTTGSQVIKLIFN